jgi:hypothetical protein
MRVTKPAWVEHKGEWQVPTSLLPALILWRRG